MNDLNIIFSGPAGAGKTTAIGAISGITPPTTDVMAGDTPPSREAGASVAMDYSMLELGNEEHIHFYGAPDQEGFDFMRDALSHGGIGLVLLLSNTRPDPFQDLQCFLDTAKDFTTDPKIVIGVTQMDLSNTPTLDDYHRQLENNGAKRPIFEVDARVKRDVSLLVEALLYTLDPGLDG